VGGRSWRHGKPRERGGEFYWGERTMRTFLGRKI